jgi:hypothetical protein
MSSRAQRRRKGYPLNTLEYSRRVAPKKSFSNDSIVIAKRLAFAQEAIQWSRERLQNTMFTDEV